MKRKNHKPSFFWQGVLVLAPVLVLAKVGALAIQQDRRMAQHDAELRAQDLAEEAADAISVALRDSNQPARTTRSPSSATVVDAAEHRLAFSNAVRKVERALESRVLRLDFDDSGQLVFPPVYERAPLPAPLDLKELSDSQRDLWERARQQSVTNAPLAELAATYEQFIAMSPPAGFTAIANLALGDVRLRLGLFADAAHCFRKLTNEPSTAVTESGLPVRQLAVFKLVQAQTGVGLEPGIYVEAFTNAAAMLLNEPTAISSELLDELAALTNTLPVPEPLLREVRLHTARALRQWEESEQARRIFEELLLVPKRAGEIPLHSTKGAGHLPFPSPAALWVSFKSIAAGAEDTRPFQQHYIESPPNWKQRNREDEPPPLTPNWSNVMPAEAFERSSRVISNYFATGTLRLIFNESWLLMKLTNTHGVTYFCRDALAVSDTVNAALKKLRIPEYLSASVSIAGEEVLSSNRLQLLQHVSGGKGGGQFWKQSKTTNAPAVLATATRGPLGHPLLAVSIHLVSPDLLYAQQEERATLFKLLIGASAIASVVGFFAAWRAFRKQLRLAEMKSNFVSSVSHELRAPIASVRLMAEGLERGKISEPAKQREYFRFITQECRRLSSMIENVLDFARIEQGRKQYEFEPTDVRALVEQTVKLMEPYAAERGVRLRSSVECGVANTQNAERGARSAEFPTGGANAPNAESHSPSPWGEGRAEGDRCVASIDGQAIQQALVNLIDNAIKHSPSGSEVLVELHGSSAPDPQITSHESPVTLSVTDHGPGIPPAEHEKIFERFYRLGSELRRETPGVGIGLGIVKHIVEAHSGRVRVESEVGQGSRFTIEIPSTAEAQRQGKEKLNERETLG